MPRENKKRGRREEKKRKRDVTADEDLPSKRPLSDDASEPLRPDDDDDGPSQPWRPTSVQEPVFYGMLNDDEQEYFKRADDMLELNRFEDSEERRLFIANVYKEADGKELKLACSQSCSRLLERLILLSTPAQLKTLLEKFGGHFLHLVRHRFASHCCEALFLQSAPIVTHELTTPAEDASTREVYVSMENLFLYTLNDLEGNLGYLMTDQHASHVLRVLLVVLSGQPLAKASTTTLSQSSKKKERVSISSLSTKNKESDLSSRSVPESFQDAVDKIISDTVSTSDTGYLRLLATHPSGNPVLQLLLELEFSHPGGRRKEKDSILAKLMSRELSTEDGSSFVRGLVYEPIGSRLLETIVSHAPGKTFKTLYRDFFRDELGNLAKNDIAGYVVTKVLERLSREDLEEATSTILPHIPKLVDRSRTLIIRTLIERSTARGADEQPMIQTLSTAYGQDDAHRLQRMIKWEDDITRSIESDKNELARQDPERVHGSLLAQSMLAVPGPLSQLIYDSLLASDRETLVLMAKEPVASRVLQTSLTLPTSTPAFRRKIINVLLCDVVPLAMHPIGSHVIDALWTATHGLDNYSERIAQPLLSRESEVRDSFVGRVVWRNWKMDLYKTRRKDWTAVAKKRDAHEATNVPGKQKQKSGIELARERYAASKAKTDSKGPGRGPGRATGANTALRISAV